MSQQNSFEDGTQSRSVSAQESSAPLRRVSMQEAQSFLAHRKKTAALIPLGVLLCILSPIVLILLAVAQETGMLSLTENQAGGIGLLVLILLVAVAVALFLLCGIQSKRFEYLEQEPFDADPDVQSLAREEKEKGNGAFSAQLVIGIVLCVISVIPIFIAMLFVEDQTSDFVYAIAVAVLLALVAAGVWLITHAAILRGSYSILLEEGDHSRSNKQEQKRMQPIAAIYWSLITAGFLAYSFITGNWQRSWIVWPVAGVLFGVVIAIAASIQGKKK